MKLLQESRAVPEDPPRLASHLTPFAGSLLITGLAAFFCCDPPTHHTLTWTSLAALATLYILATAILHTASIWTICRIFREQLETTPVPLILTFWLAIAWLPLFTLLAKEDSIYAAALPPIITACALLALRPKPSGYLIHDAAPSRHEWDADAHITTHDLFRTQPPPFWSKLWPAFATSLILQAGIATLLTGHTIYAGLLLAAALAYPLWNLPQRLYPRSSRLKQEHTRAIQTFIVLILTAVPLLPFLRYKPIAKAFGSLLHLPFANVMPPIPAIAERHYGHGKGYSGFILFLPLKPHQRTIPRTPTDAPQPSTHRAQPQVIPFDGVYWYYKHPDTRPGRDARHVHGDATKVDIHSTDYLPLSMEAHQFLGAPLNTATLRAIRVSLRNADDRPGLISIQLNLTNSATGATQSLGRIVLPSSTPRNIPLNRPAIDETLTFNIPRSHRDFTFDQLIVQIIPARERSLAGSHVAIQSFELLP
ncbi:hypothetical protein GOB94_02650 [Granulicella sp. 5B5]|uniref:hypothetical protein n=1 Tax=Granulicella sp. 5B5 TaxID=1617967 RepID=UPI0015F6ADCD|nr:hypothetical protein [Granulicella sp. 5B5]QMV17719.1 hypothetical protein GOB94_02650 [Granulicella sp. 5B5]